MQAPTVAPARAEPVVTDRRAAIAIGTVPVAVSGGRSASVAWTMNEKSPAAPGVPASVPALATVHTVYMAENPR